MVVGFLLRFPNVLFTFLIFNMFKELCPVTAENLSALYIPDEVISEVLSGTEEPSNTTEQPPPATTSSAPETSTDTNNSNGTCFFIHLPDSTPLHINALS